MNDDPPTDWPLIAPGIWLQAGDRPTEDGRPTLFLDRDGIIIRDGGFVSEPASVVLVPGAAGLIGAANRAGVPVAVVTNQSGIDRGLYGWAEFAAVQHEIERLLAAEGARLDAVAACPFHPDHTPDYGPVHAAWRKPGPAMVAALGDRLRVDRTRSWLVGDRASDIEAARGAGLAGGVLLSLPGGPEMAAARTLARSRFRVVVAADLESIMRTIPLPLDRTR